MFSSHWHHHARFYVALALAAIAAATAFALHWPVPMAIAGDVFFASYLIASAILSSSLSSADLDQRADVEDEGVLVIFLLTLAAIGFACVGVFMALNQQKSPTILPLALTMAGAPLGWFMLHTVMTFHYANIFYAGSPNDGKTKLALDFPGDEKPGVLDFFYFSFVVGMTAQVSDVQVCTTRMRRATIIHGIISFFFNTVLIAMAVNGVVANAG